MKSNSRGEEAVTGVEAPPTLRGGPTLRTGLSKKDHPAAGSAPPSYGSTGSGGENAQPETGAGAGRQGKRSAEDEQIESVVRDAEKYVTD
jgi:hypothetical protein